MSLDGKIESVKNDFLTDLDAFQNQNKDLSDIRQKYLGRNGLIADLFKLLGQISNEDRPKYGQLLNQIKVDITEKIDSFSFDNEKDEPKAGLKPVISSHLCCNLFPVIGFLQ